MGNLQETVNILTIPDQSGVKECAWSTDGQLIAASSVHGSIYVFVTKLVSLCAVSFPRIVLLSSLAEVTIYNYAQHKIKTPMNVLQLEIEPSIISIGPQHFACGMNNHAWFYDLGRSVADDPMPLGDREYMAEINDIKMNALYCAAFCGGRVLLHPVINELLMFMFDNKMKMRHSFSVGITQSGNERSTTTIVSGNNSRNSRNKNHVHSINIRLFCLFH